jgi:subfamily B ATP-binding cassette protein MsbA
MGTGMEKAIKTASSSDAFPGIKQILWQYRYYILRLIGLTSILSLLAMSLPLTARAFIDNIIQLGQREYILPISLLRLALFCLVPLLSFVQTRAVTFVAQRFVFDLRTKLYRHLLAMPLGFFSKQSTGMLVNRLMGDTGVVANMLSAQTMSIFSDIVCCSFAIAVTFILNWRMAIIVFGIIAIFVLNYRISIRKLTELSRHFRYSFDRLAGGVQNRLVAVSTVKMFGAEGKEQGIFIEQSDEAMNILREAGYANVTFWRNSDLLKNVGQAIIFFLGCYLVLQEEMTYGDVFAFTTYAMQLLEPAVRFSELARQIQDVRISIERIYELARQKNNIANSSNPIVKEKIQGDVDFENVSFEYEKGTTVIKDFSLNVKAGSSVALVGPTGCGKSTILLLLMRFYDATSGSLKIDGKDIREYDVKFIRKQFGIVLQDPQLFNISICDNIRYCKPAASREEVENAAQTAEIHSFILSLSKGYDTVIGSEGVQLSLGQKQRITIARAVLADPAIMLMDEATSALDSESEEAIQKAMARVLKMRTSFVVAHRLSTIRDASSILLLQKGQIVEHGNHEELMSIPNGKYRRLYERHIGKIFFDDKYEE